MANNRLFVGNLATTITDQDFQEAFKDAGYKSASIVTRGRLSLGYGYLDFDNAESVQQTLKKFADLKIQDSQVQYEVAKDSTYQAFNSHVTKRERKPRNVETNDTNNTTNQDNGANQGDQPARQRNNRRRNRNRNGDGEDGNNNNNNNQNENDNNDSDNVGQRRPRPRNNRRNKNNDGDGTERPPRQQREKIPSKTTLHVAGLPHSYADGDLEKIFSEFTPVSSRVVVARNGKPRGYGFVEFANEETQLKALNSKNNFVVQDGNESKTITLSISHTVVNPTPDNTTQQ
jgi:RNA recognition motif-containing protein